MVRQRLQLRSRGGVRPDTQPDIILYGGAVELRLRTPSRPQPDGRSDRLLEIGSGAKRWGLKPGVVFSDDHVFYCHKYCDRLKNGNRCEKKEDAG